MKRLASLIKAPQNFSNNFTSAFSIQAILSRGFSFTKKSHSRNLYPVLWTANYKAVHLCESERSEKMSRSWNSQMVSRLTECLFLARFAKCKNDGLCGWKKSRRVVSSAEIFHVSFKVADSGSASLLLKWTPMKQYRFQSLVPLTWLLPSARQTLVSHRVIKSPLHTAQVFQLLYLTHPFFSQQILQIF